MFDDRMAERDSHEGRDPCEDVRRQRGAGANTVDQLKREFHITLCF